MDGPIVVNFDGGSRGNPGIAGVGIVLAAMDGTPIYALGRYIGTATNNVAEYQGLILALQKALELKVADVIVRGDSELIIKQIRGEYRVRQPHLRPLYDQAKALLGRFSKSKLEHNLRHKNALADKLANLAMDRRADVTDDELPGTGISGGDESSAGSDQAPLAGDIFACRRCGARIELVKPSSLPEAELDDFVCRCGQKMLRKR
jgi:ribonuclease HI